LSSRRFRFARTVFLLVALLLTGSVGCWEQWSNDWFPQMKWQPAVQAFERVEWQGRLEGFLPPEGTVPISGGEADNSKMTDEAAATLLNPRPRSVSSSKASCCDSSSTTSTIPGSLRRISAWW
jgi:hypothetical protein